MFTHLEVAQGPWAAGPGSELECQGSRCQAGLASCPVSGVSTSSFPPAPSESCRFSLPAGGNTPPEGERKTQEALKYLTRHNQTEMGLVHFVFSKSYNMSASDLLLCSPTRTCRPRLFARTRRDSPSADP